MNTALLIIDIQNDYFDKGANALVGSEEASQNAMLVLEKFRKENAPVIHVQHLATRPDATFFLPETDGAQIHKNVKPTANEIIVVKHFPNSFRETDLLSHLVLLGINNLVICGMMTHMCIDATTRSAKDYGFNIVLIGDACATKDLEINGQTVKAKEVQNSFLAALNYFYATVKGTRKYIEE
jgi:nicotinamidase-related amidase